MIKKNIIILLFIFCSCSKYHHFSQDLGYTKDGVHGYTHFKDNEPVAIYSNFYDSCFVEMVDLQPEQEAGYMVTILDKKKNFFYVRFDYPNIGKAWVKKGSIGLNIRGLAYENKDSIPIHEKTCLKSRIIGYLVNPQTVPILDEGKHWVYIKAIDGDKNEIEGWLAPIYQCGNPYTTCP